MQKMPPASGARSFMTVTVLSRILWVFMLLTSSYAVSSSRFNDDETFRYLNEIRTHAGMHPFKRNQTLDRAAQMHADYLLINNAWGHDQRPGHHGFTGVTPLERMLKAGYSSRHNSENVSTHKGEGDALKSIDGLMGAIYHRFTFLTFDYDEVGIGQASQGDYYSYVYNLGNSHKVKLCNRPEDSFSPGHYIFKVCADQQKRISQSVFESALTDVQKLNPDYVVWPADSMENVPPAFYNEAPDPLPGVDVSGYPVSIQFNPSIFNTPPKLTRFELYEKDSGQPVELLASFNENTDIHGKFTAYENAIFPRYRFNWNTVYRAEVDYLDSNNETQSISWQFKTQAFDKPFFEVAGSEEIHAAYDQLIVYSPPVSAVDAKSEYQVSFIGFRDVQVRILDAHTLLISPKGMRGRAEFDFHGKRFSVFR